MIVLSAAGARARELTIQALELGALDFVTKPDKGGAAENLAALRRMNLQPTDFARRGKHPALGEVTLSQLLATWAAHDLTHLHQISRIMAHQYREAVGPWSAYLGVMQCAGHSS